ncbi:unnamed protein product [Schistosoma margrebowiei]|uniref:Uncharacterized protein n=1 Tax=Schistosoma margrebowiei TaxID=48269 RepID=A0A183LKC0_9TREM|nr:unnamed protein product [Schistosoma margrebowiei]
MVAGDQQLVHTPFFPAGYWSLCAPLVWNPVKAPDIHFSSSHFRIQHSRHENTVWHRRCFRCQHCGMALSICNYHGGYDKKPYCAAHTPKPTSFTFIPDTPELLRVANNTRMFSSIRYSADAQRIRSKITSFPDDLWTQHTLRLSKQYSEANSVRSGRSSGFDERCSPQSYGRSASYYNSYTPPPTRFGLSNQCTSPHTFSNSSGINSRPLSNSGGCHLKIDPINHHHHYDQGHTPPANHNGLSRSGSCHSVIITPTVLRDLYRLGNIIVFHGHTHQNSGFGGTFVAQYGYEAREDDEVTFKSGDIIVNGAPITEGWMYGTVQRTGKFGMLPSNYVKPYR